MPKSIGCSGCKRYLLDFLEIRQKTGGRIVIICSEELAASIPSSFKYPVLVDTFGSIDQLNLQTQNVALIATSDNQIQEIVTPDANNIDSTVAAYFATHKGT